MGVIELPLPDFSFDEIAKEKAQFIIRHILHNNSLMQYFTGSNNGLENRMQIEISKLFENYERLICIVELLNFLIAEENNLKSNISFNTKEPATIVTGFNKIRYVLYSLAKSYADYNFDRNQFNTNDIADIITQINGIVDTLCKLEAGQEVLFDKFDEVKLQIVEEFENLKTSPVFGKKTFYQLMFGKIATFTGNKIADEIFKILAPQIIGLLAIQAPHLIEEFQKLLK